MLQNHCTICYLCSDSKSRMSTSCSTHNLILLKLWFLVHFTLILVTWKIHYN